MSNQSSAIDFAQDSEQVACEICLREIPQSEAHSLEASEYVAHFCGLECYDQWRQGQNKGPD